MFSRWPFTGRERWQIRLSVKLSQRLLQTPSFAVAVWGTERKQWHGFLELRSASLQSEAQKLNVPSRIPYWDKTRGKYIWVLTKSEFCTTSHSVKKIWSLKRSLQWSNFYDPFFLQLLLLHTHLLVCLFICYLLLHLDIDSTKAGTTHILFTVTLPLSTMSGHDTLQYFLNNTGLYWFSP